MSQWKSKKESENVLRTDWALQSLVKSIDRRASKQTGPLDFISWAQRYIILPNGENIAFEDHQKVILNHVFDYNKEGRLPYQTIIYSCPKKSGKTTINSIVMLYWLFNVEAPNEVLCVANKRDQAIARGYKEARGFIERNPALMDEVVKISDRGIELKNGSTLIAIPNDFAGEAGSNHGLTTWDELWGFTTERDRRLYDELTPVPTRKNSIRLITTYAGFEGESQLLEDLYHQIFKGNGNPKMMVKRPLGKNLPCYSRGSLFVYWDHEPRMSWQTFDYYESQKGQLRANTYLRLHENRWVSSEISMFNMDRWDQCTKTDHKPPLPNKNLRLWVGIDASVKRDRSAVVSVYKDGDTIYLGPKRFWQPSAKNPMDLEQTMEAFLLELNKNFSLINCFYDPFQFHRSATTLLNQGLPMTEFTQSTTNLIEAGQNLYDLIEYKNIVLYSCKELRYEATCAVAKSTDRGLRIVKDKSSHKIDQIIALAMAALPASKEVDYSRVEIRTIASSAVDWGHEFQQDY